MSKFRFYDRKSLCERSGVDVFADRIKVLARSHTNIYHRSDIVSDCKGELPTYLSSQCDTNCQLHHCSRLHSLFRL